MSSLSGTRRYPSPAAIAFAAVLSGFFYGTAVLGLLFLLPVQFVYGRYGRKEGLVASLIALLAALVGQLVPMLAGGDWASLLSASGGMGKLLLSASLPPAIVLAGLALMNAPFWKGELRYFGGMAGATLVSLAAVPGIIDIVRDGKLIAQFEESFGAFVDSFLAQAGNNAETEALKASLDIKMLAHTAIMVLQCGFAAFIFGWMATSRWLGNRISGKGSLDRQEAASLAEYRLPYLLVWPFMAAWAGVLGASYFKLGMPWKAAVWNIALVLSLSYAVQGLGIASHLMRRWNLPRGLRICLAITAILVAMTPPAGYFILGFIPLLGVTETWIPYRNPKGVTA